MCYLQILNADYVVLYSKTPEIHFQPCSNTKTFSNTLIRTLTTQWVVLAESVITFLAVVAARAFDVGFAATLSCDHPHVQVGVTVTHSSLQGSDWVTVTG